MWPFALLELSDLGAKSKSHPSSEPLTLRHKDDSSPFASLSLPLLLSTHPKEKEQEGGERIVVQDQLQARTGDPT
jgi:hypothetical protein